MKRLIPSALTAFVLIGASVAVADLVIKDGNSPSLSQTMFDYVCFTSKHCSASVMINSAGAEVGTTGSPFQVGSPTLATAAQMTSLISAVNGPIPAGTATIGGVTRVAGTTGGSTATFAVAAASNNSTNLKATAGVVYGLQMSNIHATIPYFIKFYDKATAPTCGTDTPVAAYVIPPANGGNNVVLAIGKQFNTGIGYCIVTGIANSDNTAVPAATVLANIDWK